MQKEYIEREELIAEFKRLELGENSFIERVFADGVYAVIEQFPAADVVEVRHGDWILRHVGAGHYWECSVCHENPCIYVTKNTKFCPNCGAYMMGESNGKCE